MAALESGMKHLSLSNKVFKLPLYTGSSYEATPYQVSIQGVSEAMACVELKKKSGVCELLLCHRSRIKKKKGGCELLLCHAARVSRI